MKPTFVLFCFTLTLSSVHATTPSPISVWSGEGNAADYVGGNSGSTNAVTFAPGKNGQAFSFNGYTSYVLVPDSTSLDRPHVTNALTLTAWIKWDGVAKPDLCPIARKATASGVTSYPWMTFDFLVGNNGKPGLSISNGYASGPIVGCESSVPITSGEWHFVAGTYDGAVLKIYVDGQLRGTQAANIVLGDREGPLYIGATTPYANNNNFGGLIDELCLYDQALTGAQIQAAGGFNLAPTANAGPDQVVYIGSNAQGSVTLNGSASTDAESDPLTYTWTGTFGTATGVSPTITLPAGIHMINLSVTDGYNQPTTATVHVAVVAGVDSNTYAQMQSLLQSLTAQAQADAATIDALTQKNASLNTLLQSLATAFDQIKTSANTIISISDEKKQAITTALNGN